MNNVIKSVVILVLGNLLLVNLGMAQNKMLDSIYHVVDTAKQRITVADAHAAISWALVHTDVEIAQAHLDTAKILFENENDAFGIAMSQYQEGLINRVKGQYKKAIENYDRYMVYADTIPDRVRGESMAYNCGFQYGVIYGKQGDYEKSLKTFFSLLGQELTNPEIVDRFNLHNSIGNIYNKLENFDEAKKHYNLALNNLKDSDLEGDHASVYSNLSDVYVAEGKYDKGIDFTFKAIEIFKSSNNNLGLAHCYLDLGNTYLIQNKLDEAERYLVLSKDVFEENDFEDKKLSYLSLGELYMKKLQINNAENYFNKALSLDLDLVNQMYLHEGLAKLNRYEKKYKLALNHFEQYAQVKDSLSGIETIKDINRLQFQYESVSKDKEIIEQDLTIKEQEITILTKEAKSTRNMLLAFVALGGLIFSFFYFRQRQRLKNKEIEALKVKQEVTKLESLIEGEEKERERLAKDLHDGINGDLSVIKFKINSLDDKKFTESENQEFNLAVGMLDNAIEQVRSISHDLAPPSLQNYNLVEAIQQYCLKIASIQSMAVNFQNYGDIVNLEKEKETAVYRIVQELINNTVKHANASEVLVQMNFHKNNLHITVEDNGSGYDVQTNKAGLGLKNIASRTIFLGANMVVDSDSKGTITTLDIDLNPTKK